MSARRLERLQRLEASVAKKPPPDSTRNLAVATPKATTGPLASSKRVVHEQHVSLKKALNFHLSTAADDEQQLSRYAARRCNVTPHVMCALWADRLCAPLHGSRVSSSSLSSVRTSPRSVDIPVVEAARRDSGDTETGMQVCVRVRPLQPGATPQDDVPKRGVNPERTRDSGGGLDAVSLQGQTGTYRFHAVYEKEDNAELFRKLGVPLVRSVLGGYNGTLMAYGQTGAGKTYTLGEYGLDSGPHAGLMPRMVRRLMTSVAADRSCEVRLQYVQLYLEQIHDVLAPDKGPLSLREDPAGGACVPGASNVLVANERDAIELLEQAPSLLYFYYSSYYYYDH